MGPDFTVLATVGHFRDLDETAGKKYGGVDPDNDFSLSYAVYPSSKKILSEIVRTLKGCERLILATDPDREGEAIAWHLHEYLTEKKALTYKTVHRVVFHEIPKKSCSKSIQRAQRSRSAFGKRRSSSASAGYDFRFWAIRSITA